MRLLAGCSKYPQAKILKYTQQGVIYTMVYNY